MKVVLKKPLAQSLKHLKVLLKLNVTESDLSRFEEDLWKDSRVLEVDSDAKRKIIRRYSDKQVSIKEEYRFIVGMIKKVSFQIPGIVEHTNSSISFDYIAGTRAFNLLMDLRVLYQEENVDIYRKVGAKLIDYLGNDLKEFQKAFLSNPVSQSNRKMYPAKDKLTNVYTLLASVLGIDADLSEIEAITKIYVEHALVPFRDATTKNVILDLPHLFKKRFNSHQERQKAIKNMVLSGELGEKLNKNAIYHIDFSGCSHYCPIFDDWVALREHEAAAWLGLETVPSIDDLSIPELCTKFVRYSRFGGRKLAYHLLNIQGYKIRFGLDSEAFYFHHLQNICIKLQEHNVLKTQALALLMKELEEATAINPKTDYFHNWKSHHRNHSYYSDVFPV